MVSFSCFRIARDGLVKRYFGHLQRRIWTSTPKHNTAQNTIMDPRTVYGITSLAGERWNEYYYNKFE